jgi:hypothetical protein
LGAGAAEGDALVLLGGELSAEKTGIIAKLKNNPKTTNGFIYSS